MPAISLPCGFVNGLPIGISLVGRPFSENHLVALGKDRGLGPGIAARMHQRQVDLRALQARHRLGADRPLLASHRVACGALPPTTVRGHSP